MCRTINYDECGAQLIVLSVTYDYLFWVWRMVDCVECGVQIIKLSVAYKKLVECGVQLITSMYKFT